MGGLKSKLRRPKSASRKEKDGSNTKQKSKTKKASLPDSQSAKKTVDPRLPFANYRQIFSIRNAWKAVSRSMEDCAKETLIRFLNQHPMHRDKIPDIKDITEEDDMRASEAFENTAMEIYQVFDDVINNLENVDAALKEIRRAAMSFPLNKQMLKDMKEPFVETIKLTLGTERFTEATEDNFKLLYQFVHDEIGKHLTEVEVNCNVESESEVKVEQNSVKQEGLKEDFGSTGFVSTELQNQGEINANGVEERGT